MWQDFVLGFLQIGLSAALVPAVLSNQKPDKYTCLMNFLFLFAMACVFFTMGLWFSTATTLMVSLLWFTLLIQKRGYTNA